MARPILFILMVLTGIFAAANATGCYSYTTSSQCSGKTCTGGKCYWEWRKKKRSLDEIPQLEEGEVESESERELEREKRVFNPDYPDDPFPDEGSCDCCSISCTPPKILLEALCTCICPTPIPSCTGGKIYNYATCKCECPANSHWDNSVGNCVGDCKWLASSVCTKVRCNVNKHANCILSGSSCRCPTCNDYYHHHSLCLQTKCTSTWAACKWKYYPYYPYYYCSCY